MPAYHQEKTIRDDIRQIESSLHLLKIPYELIVVVDGGDVSIYQKELRHLSKHIRVVGYPNNHGKGYAVRYGMSRSKGDLVAFIDAGGDISADVLSMMLAHFTWYQADIIVGSKRHPVSKVNYPLFRRILSWGYQFIIRILFGLRIRDTQVGVKLYRRVVLEDVLPRLLVKKFAFDIEILAVANHLGYSRIYESPVELDFTGASSITSASLWNVIANMLWDTFAIFYRLKILHYYDSTNKRKWLYDSELNFRVNID